MTRILSSPHTKQKADGQAPGWLLALLLVGFISLTVLISQSGCRSSQPADAMNRWLDRTQSARQNWRLRQPRKESTQSVRLNRWLDQPRSVAFDVAWTQESTRPAPMTLRRLLETDRNHSEALSKLRHSVETLQREQADIELAPEMLRDDIVVLQRGTDRWYFPRPWLATDVVGNLGLRDGDVVLTLPFAATVFCPEESSPSPVEVFVTGEESRINRFVTLKTSSNRDVRMLLGKRGSELQKNWSVDQETTATMLTREVNGRQHHFILPVAFQGDPDDWLVSACNVIANVQRSQKVESGDVIWLTRRERIPAWIR